MGWVCPGCLSGTGKLIPDDQKDAPYHMASCSACRAGGRRKKGDVWSVDICLPKSPLPMLQLCFLEMAEEVPDSGK